MKNDKCGIYEIVCIVNNKRYIGSSKHIFSRFKYEHKYKLKNNKHLNPHLQYAWNKYSENNFEVNVLKECSEEKLIEYEQRYIDKLKPEYNFHLVAGRPPKMCKPVTLKNYKTGEIVTRYSRDQFAKEFNLNRCSISSVVEKRIKTAGDWCLPETKIDLKEYKLKDISGKIYTFISPTKFAKEHNLDVNRIQGVLRKTSKIYKGWRLPETKIKQYSLISPTNKKYTFTNVTKFAKENDLTVSGILSIVRKVQKTHRSWRLHDVSYI